MKKNNLSIKWNILVLTIFFCIYKFEIGFFTKNFKKSVNLIYLDI